MRDSQAFPLLHDPLTHGTNHRGPLYSRWLQARFHPLLSFLRCHSSPAVVEDEPYAYHNCLPHIPTQFQLPTGTSKQRHRFKSPIPVIMKSPSTFAGLAAEVAAHPCCSCRLLARHSYPMGEIPASSLR